MRSLMRDLGVDVIRLKPNEYTFGTQDDLNRRSRFTQLILDLPVNQTTHVSDQKEDRLR